MNRTSLLSIPLIALAALSATGNNSAAEEKILFADSFSDVKGHVIGQTDGKIFKGGEAPTRQLLPFMGISPLANGKLTIVAFEDSLTAGPDGKPGVLAISIVDVPRIATYCGFAFLGGLKPENALTLNEITGAPTLENLRRLKLRFRFKAANDKDAAAVGAALGCRLEPLVNNSFASRLAFGVIEANGEWQSFDRSLGDGENAESFLKTITADQPTAYKLIWSQIGSITRYQPGDTLLIDDIQIVQTAPEK